ncbi:MAG: 7-cyano-7-deazaguanine synthase QueC [Candidatus Eisenbacteria bacterium]
MVLLSGGLDSVVNLKCAIDECEVGLALTFDYGQAAFANEKHAAAGCAERYGIPHQVVDLRWYEHLLPGAISGLGEALSFGERLPEDGEGLLNEAWVPNRNCVFLSIGGAFAEASGADGVVIGINREEAEVFPDNTEAFRDAMNSVLSISTRSGVRVVTYTSGMSKKEIVELGRRIGAPLDLIYSCYRRSDDQRMCGSCQSCMRLKTALRKNQILDEFKGRFAS